MRDKFPANVVEVLAKRAGQRCSYCGLATSGPYDDPSKWVNVGEAAHIKAVSKDGPRHDPDQSAKERISAENGIWLCSRHHTLIDRDVARFPADALYRLKVAAEDRIRKEIGGGGSALWFKPIFDVPYPRNIYFTGREEVLQRVAAQLNVGGKAVLGQAAPSDLQLSSRAAISGLGGIGKTQTAVEFAYLHREDYRAVFFVRATTAGELLSGFADIAARLGIAGQEKDQKAAAQAVRQWLETNSGWLLILDNADEPALLEPYLPADGQGHILITSRAQDFAALSIKSQRIALSPHDEALGFLLHRTRRQTTGEAERKAAAELANELGNLPQALELAADYISTRQVSFAAYLASYRRRGLDLVEQSDPQAGTRHSSVADFSAMKTLDHPLAAGIAPAWAAEWGEDRFGIFAVLRVGEAEQKLRFIPPGSFRMGSPDDEEGRWDDEGPRCLVTLNEGFWLADTPCTQAFWEEVMSQNPSEFKSRRHPVEQVSWEEVQVFLRRLEERIPNTGAQLPTEAQWEFACRAGTETSTYAPTTDLGEIAWYFENSGGSAQDVGLKKPNGWGLYDTLGNVWEWCGDYWSRGYDGKTKQDPTGPLVGSSRVIRGGSWRLDAGIVRAASRYGRAPGVRYENLGFRFSLGRPRSG